MSFLNFVNLHEKIKNTCGVRNSLDRLGKPLEHYIARSKPECRSNRPRKDGHFTSHRSVAPLLVPSLVKQLG